MTFSGLFIVRHWLMLLCMYTYIRKCSSLPFFFLLPENQKTSVLRVLSQTSLFNWRVPVTTIAVVWAIIDYLSECVYTDLSQISTAAIIHFFYVYMLYILSSCLIVSSTLFKKLLRLWNMCIKWYYCFKFLFFLKIYIYMFLCVFKVRMNIYGCWKKA
jgi:hypothetical protein